MKICMVTALGTGFPAGAENLGGGSSKFGGRGGLKVVSATFVLVSFLSLNESSCQMRKYVFSFTLKAFVVLEKIKF